MASPRTIRGDVNGTGVVTYELPPGLFQYVQAIRVEVDNTFGGDARPKLDIAEQSGVVIATKRQGEAIPAGDTGSGTWALRLDDESPGGASVIPKLGVYSASVQSIPSGSTTNFSFTDDGYDPLLDLTFPSAPKFVAAGAYIVSAVAFSNLILNLPAAAGELNIYEFGNVAGPRGIAYQNVMLAQALGGVRCSASVGVTAGAGTRIQASFEHNAGVPLDFSCYLNVLQVG